MWPEGKEEGVTWVPWVERKSPQEPWLRHIAPRRQGCGSHDNDIQMYSPLGLRW